MLPTTYVKQLNTLSSQIDQRERIEAADLSRIAAIDAVMRETVSLIIDVSTVQLRLVNSLVQLPSEKRDYKKIHHEQKESFRKIFEENILEYERLLKAKSKCMENSREVPITGEKRTELIEKFSVVLERTLGEFENEIELNPRTDLARLKNLLEEKIKIHKEIYTQMSDSKKILSEHAFKIIHEKEALANPKDPNHLQQLLELTPRFNSEITRKYLVEISGRN